MSGYDPVQTVLDRLRNVREHDGDWTATCPAHDDRHPSLSITRGGDGRVLLHCHAGCDIHQIVAALDLTLADLFPRARSDGDTSPGKPFEHSNASHHANESSEIPHGEPGAGDGAHGLTLAAYAAAKKLPEAFLRHLGLADNVFQKMPRLSIPYYGPGGVVLATRYRIALTGQDRFRWQKGATVQLYGRWKLPMAREHGYVVVCEGESDCHTLWYHNVPAVGVPGAANWREERDAPCLDGIATVYVLIEPDTGGETVLAWVSRSAIRDRVRLVTLGEFKDVSAMHIDSPEHFTERWQAAIADAVPWSDHAERVRKEAAVAAAAQAERLLHDRRLLARVAVAIRRRGYAGDVRLPLLVYLAATSRLLERPVNLAVVAQSASGKNHAVDAGLALVPAEAIYAMDAGSPRALIYCEEDFAHHVVYVGEADSLPAEGPAASAIRSLASKNEMVYDVVERNERTGRFETRHIVRPGPTSLITTSTKRLDPQMGTRMLELSVPDSAAQTRAVLRAQANAAMPTTADRSAAVDLTPFHALQAWLAVAGERRVAVPYARALAEAVPADAVRMRRDFPQLLTCIRTVAFLYQCQRARTPEGWVVATLADYAVARDLLAAIFDASAAEGLTPAIRATVEAVEPGEEVSAAALGGRLKLAKATISYRVGRAVAGGWLVNRETRKGLPARLARGAPMPDAISALPTPAQVRAAFERSNRPERYSNGESPGTTGETAGAFESSHASPDDAPPPDPGGWGDDEWGEGKEAADA